MVTQPKTLPPLTPRDKNEQSLLTPVGTTTRVFDSHQEPIRGSSSHVISSYTFQLRQICMQPFSFSYS